MGQVAVVIYEWSDADYLGKVTSQPDDTIPVSCVSLPLCVPSLLSRNGPAENVCLHLGCGAPGFLYGSRPRSVHHRLALWKACGQHQHTDSPSHTWKPISAGITRRSCCYRIFRILGQPSRQSRTSQQSRRPSCPIPPCNAESYITSPEQRPGRHSV